MTGPMLLMLGGIMLAWLSSQAGAGQLGRLSERTVGSSGITRPAVALSVVLSVVAVAAVGGLRAAGWFAASGVATTTIVLMVLRARARAARRMFRVRVAEAADALAGQLRVGKVPGVALCDAAAECPALQAAAAASRLGGDVAEELARAAGRPGGHGLAALAGAWSIGTRSGAPIAELVAQVATELRRAERNEQLLDGEVAGARMAGWLLSALPMAGVVLGYLGGGDPLRFLGSSQLGMFLSLGAVFLVSGGIWWIEGLVDRARGGA